MEVTKGKRITIKLAPFPQHELDWLCLYFGKSYRDTIQDAVIVTAAEFRQLKGGLDEQEMDKTLGGRVPSGDDSD